MSYILKIDLDTVDRGIEKALKQGSEIIKNTRIDIFSILYNNRDTNRLV